MNIIEIMLALYLVSVVMLGALDVELRALNTSSSGLMQIRTALKLHNNALSQR